MCYTGAEHCSRSRAAVTLRSVPPTICLNMIVRDEASVIAETLDSVAAHLHYWVVVDTGSRDDTVKVIRSYFEDRDIAGEIHERAWRDFGRNRSEALALCRGKADYAWVIDADDIVVGEVDLSPGLVRIHPSGLFYPDHYEGPGRGELSAIGRHRWWFAE
jgi:glycosyltransferase involved in cell wall biosynthesis